MFAEKNVRRNKVVMLSKQWEAVHMGMSAVLLKVVTVTHHKTHTTHCLLACMDVATREAM